MAGYYWFRPLGLDAGVLSFDCCCQVSDIRLLVVKLRLINHDRPARYNSRSSSKGNDRDSKGAGYDGRSIGINDLILKHLLKRSPRTWAASASRMDMKEVRISLPHIPYLITYLGYHATECSRRLDVLSKSIAGIALNLRYLQAKLLTVRKELGLPTAWRAHHTVQKC